MVQTLQNGGLETPIAVGGDVLSVLPTVTESELHWILEVGAHSYTLPSRRVRVPAAIPISQLEEHAPYLNPSSASGVGGCIMASIVLQVPGDISYRELVTRTVASVCKIARPDQEAGLRFRDELVSAVGEAFNNCVFHAYANCAGEITLQIDIAQAVLTIDIFDSGASFDLEQVPSPDLSNPQESGMGLYIIRSFVDEVTYLPGCPNRLRLAKRLPQPRPP